MRSKTRFEAAPPFEWFCDSVVIAFALWTVCCHAVVFSGGTLRSLLLVFTAVFFPAMTIAIKMRLFCSDRVPPPRTSPAGECGSAVSWRIRILYLIACTAALTGLFWTGNVLAFWWVSLVLLSGGALLILRGERRPEHIQARSGRLTNATPWILGVACVVLTAVCHRPDPDDSFYVNIAVSAADMPSWPLLSSDTIHGIGGLPLHLPIYRLHTYEILNGALSFLTGIPAICCFHWIAAAFAAFMVPLSLSMLYRFLTPRIWPVCVFTNLVVLIMVGDVHRWYGNFAFVRMWQGKSIFLSVAWALVCASAIRYSSAPSWRGWVMLFASQVAALGLSSTALWVAPLIVLTTLACLADLSRASVWTVILGASSSLYMVCGGLLIRGPLTVTLQGIRAVTGPKAGMTYKDAFTWVLGDSRLLTLSLFAILASWVFSPRGGPARRLALGFPLAGAVLILNPYLAELIKTNVTGTAYWRILWMLPVPMLITLLLTAPIVTNEPLAIGSVWKSYVSSRRRSRQTPRHECHDERAWMGSSMRWMAFAFLLATFGFFIPSFSGLGMANGCIVRVPGLKVPAVEYRWASILNGLAGQGAHVVAPRDINTWIPTMHHHAYPLTVRHYLLPNAPRIGKDNLIDRVTMTRYAGGDDRSDAAARVFRSGLDRFSIKAVCMHSGDKDDQVRGALRGAHFVLATSGDHYEIWVRARPPESERGDHATGSRGLEEDP